MIAALPRPSAGMLVHNLPEGRSTCASCGWQGVPSFVRGEVQHACPACGQAAETDRRRAALDVTTARPVAKVARNAPCPCGSGVKAKKCCHA